MSLVTFNWKSDVIGKQTAAQIILPDIGKPPYPTLYLLHGLSDDSTAWMRRTRIEYYARELPLIIVMPDGYRGFYTRNEQGPDYARHLAEETLATIERNFHALPLRDARAIGGLSMGGYGALRIALGYPEKFCSVTAHSAAVSTAALHGNAPAGDAPPHLKIHEQKFLEELRRIFGEHPENTDHDIAHLAARAKAADKLPRIHIDCGTEDFLLEANRQLHARLTSDKVPHTYVEHPGAHNWDYWDLHIQTALRFHAQTLNLPAPNH